MSSENRPKDFFAKQIRSSHLIASGGIINPNSSDWDETYDNLKLMIYPKDALEITSPFGGGAPLYIDGAFEGIVPPTLLEDSPKSSGGTGLKVGEDVWLFISGSQNSQHVAEGEKRDNGGVVLFGGDVVVSGTLYAERQVVEVDLLQEGELFVSGNLKVQDHTADVNFVQFMMPAENYPLQWDGNALSFTDSTGVDPAIDIQAIEDGSAAGNYNLTLYSSFDTAELFSLDDINETISNYRYEVIQEAIKPEVGGDIWDSILAFRAVYDAIFAMSDGNVDDFNGSEPYPVASLDADLAAIEAAINQDNTALSAEEAAALYIEQMTLLVDALDPSVRSNSVNILNWIRGELEDHDTNAATEEQTPGGITSSEITAAEDLLNAAIADADAHVYSLAYNEAPATATPYTSAEDVITAGMAYSGFRPSSTGENLSNPSVTIFNVDSLNGRVGVLNVDPQAALDLRPGYGEGNTPTAHTNHRVWDDATSALIPVQLYTQDDTGTLQPLTAGESVFWHANTQDENNLTWSHASAADAPEVLKIIGLKEDITNYDQQSLEPKVLTITDDGLVRFKEGGLGGGGDTAWLWPDTDGVEGGDKVILKDETNMVGIGTENPVQKVHVYSGEGLNTAIRVESNEKDNTNTVINPDAHVKIEMAIDGMTHSAIRQQVRPTQDSSSGTDLLFQNYSISGGHYFTTNHLANSTEYALAPLVIDSNGNAEGDQLQVLILSGTTGEDQNGLNPRLFADSNFFVSGSIGSCVNPTDLDGNVLQAGNGERGTAVFGGDVYVSGTIFGASGVVGAGGGWMTAINGVCMDVFTESAYGDEGTTPASDYQLVPATLMAGAPTPDSSSETFIDFNFYMGFYSTEAGTTGNGTQIVLTLSTNTASLDYVDAVWSESTNVLSLTVPFVVDTDDPADGVGDVRVDFQKIIDKVNGEGIYSSETPTWPIRARGFKTWNSSNIDFSHLTTPDTLHLSAGNGGTGPTDITFTLLGGGNSVRYVSWGADATSGYSPSEGLADNTGDTFTRQDWAQGLVIPFDCTIVGYSVRYMSKDPFRMSAPGYNPTGTEEVIWEIGTLNEGTDPAAGASYTGDVTKNVVFTQLSDENTGAPPRWIRWTVDDDGTYPIRWIGEGDDQSSSLPNSNHAASMELNVLAGDTVTVRAVEKDCEVYSDYRAEASVTLWLSGGGSISLGSGGTSGGTNSSGGLAENDVKSTTILDPANDAVATYTNPYGEQESKLIPDLTSLINYISLNYIQGQNMLIELPDAGLASGYSFIIKDSMGLASETSIRIAPQLGQMLDQFQAWETSDNISYTIGQDSFGNNVEPLKIEQNFASITVWSDGLRWLIS